MSGYKDIDRARKVSLELHLSFSCTWPSAIYLVIVLEYKWDRLHIVWASDGEVSDVE